MNIVILMGRNNLNYKLTDCPIYLTEIQGITLLERQINAIRECMPERIIFCVKEHELNQYNITQMINQMTLESQIIKIKGSTYGAICTALLAIDYIDNYEELILLSIDEIINVNFNLIVNTFRKEQADAGITYFHSIHPRYSYVRIEEDHPIEFSEKKTISQNALVSFYYFKHGSDFVECAKDVIRKDNQINDAFYLSQTLNEMILKHKSISTYKIENDKYYPIKTELQLTEYISEKISKK